MKLVDMKLPKRSKKELSEAIPVDYENQDRWPYGLQIRFEKDQIAQLPVLTKYKVGDTIILTAEGTVTGVRMSERIKGSNDHSVEIQLEKVNVEPKIKKAIKEMTPQEYKEMRMGK